MERKIKEEYVRYCERFQVCVRASCGPSLGNAWAADHHCGDSEALAGEVTGRLVQRKHSEICVCVCVSKRERERDGSGAIVNSTLTSELRDYLRLTL